MFELGFYLRKTNYLRAFCLEKPIIIRILNKIADGKENMAGVVNDGKNFALNYGIANSKERLFLLLILLLNPTTAKRGLKAY